MRFLLILIALLLPLALTSCMTNVNPEKIAAANEVTLEKEGIKALKVGDKAPEFTATTATGERVMVGAATSPPTAADGKAPVSDATADYTVLYFYPADFTPNSSKHLLDLSKGLDQLAAQHIKVYGVSTGTADAHKEYAAKQGITLPLLVDTGLVGASYGVLLTGGKYPQRTLVGIKPDGSIGFYKRGFGHQKLVDLILKETGRAPAPEPAAK